MSDPPPPALSFAETTIEVLLAAAASSFDAVRDRPPNELERDVRARVASIVGRNAHLVLDPPTGQWLQRTSIVLAVYQTLETIVDRTELISVLRDAMVEPFKEKMSDYLLNRFGISQDAPKEAFARIAENFKARGEERFGKAFVYVQDVQDANRTFTNIHQCFFNDFFRVNGSPEVTSIFCALDSVWVEALHDGDYEVRFARPTMLSQGADACRFQFSKSAASSGDALKSCQQTTGFGRAPSASDPEKTSNLSGSRLQSSHSSLERDGPEG